MVRKKVAMLIGAAVLILLPLTGLNASEKDVNGGGIDRRAFRLSVEYFSPTDEDRNIRTINLNAYYRLAEVSAIHLSIDGGLTATYATGHITQLEGDLSAGTLREVNFDTEAFGLGPVILADLRLFRRNRVSLHLDGSGSVILYNRDFPAGGDRYNFMWRMGPVLRYRIGKNQSIGLGYQWMHVSNGQGMGPKNPSYDAQGLSLELGIVF